LLKGGGHASSSRLGLIDLEAIELIESEILLLDAVKEIHFNGIVIVNEQPATSVNEETGIVLGKVSITYNF
jgi:hypothetical protein